MPITQHQRNKQKMINQDAKTTEHIGPLIPRFLLNKRFDFFHPMNKFSFIFILHVLVQEYRKIIIYAPCLQKIIKQLLQLII